MSSILMLLFVFGAKFNKATFSKWNIVNSAISKTTLIGDMSPAGEF